MVNQSENSKEIRRFNIYIHIGKPSNEPEIDLFGSPPHRKYLDQAQQNSHRRTVRVGNTRKKKNYKIEKQN